MPHQRPQRATDNQSSSSSQPSQPQVQRQSSQQVFLGDLAGDVKALNSSVLLLSQKMQYLVRNEKILGRNLLVLNKKFEEFQSKKPSEEAGASPKEFVSLRQELDNANSEVNRLNRSIVELRDSIEQFKINYARLEDLKEIKYVIDAINPLEFVSVKQVDALVERKMQESLKKK